MREFVKDLESELGEHLYPEQKTTQSAWTQSALECSEIVTNCLTRQFIKSQPESNSVLRLSQLGKPAVELAGRHFFPEKHSAVTYESVKRTFFFGDLFEVYVYFTLKRLSHLYQIDAYQPEVEWYGLKGHPDFLVTDLHTGEGFVVDAKTANDRYFKSVDKWGIDDERGYLTQLATYAEATNRTPVLLFCNKNTSELGLSFPTADQVSEHTDRARKLVDCIRKCKKFEDIFKYLKPPAPVRETERVYVPKAERKGKETHRTVETGRWVLPYEMRYSAYKELFYVMQENYVLDYRYPSKYAHLKPDMVA